MITTIIILAALFVIWKIWKSNDPAPSNYNPGGSSNENPAPKPPKQK
jgi:hypothetical protein